MQYRKPAISIADQIQLLESRGMTISDKATANHFLSFVSYYRLAGYWWPLQSDKVDHTFLSSWLRSIAVVRNICAHHSRLWNRNLPMPPKLLTRANLPWITNPALVDIHSFYAALTCMHYLLQTISPGNHFKQRLTDLLQNYPNIDIKAMGFPIDWKKEALWQ